MGFPADSKRKQVKSHGVTPPLLEEFKREVIELFKLPIEEKKKLWQQEDSLEGFGNAFVVSEQQMLDWRNDSSSSYPQSGLVSEFAFKSQGHLGSILQRNQEPSNDRSSYVNWQRL
ncbi:hypothetical protein H5410_007456 [Solanum commersonii]|uniref:Non-haem dioxygenase N-terminal domain-containing protein n=1 Tax=Solanum commersonii TaxID=4109 RepID=A0A9J6AC16_SOLCO|nr:hypothetical protein H5410_007456 [Solanum commersonii]